MAKLDDRKTRIAAIASRLIAGQIERGQIDICPRHDDHVEGCLPCAEMGADIRAAMPEAVATARAVYDAAVEYISG